MTIAVEVTVVASAYMLVFWKKIYNSEKKTILSLSQRDKNVCGKFYTIIIIIIITTQTTHFYNIRAFHTRRPARRWHYLCQQNTVRHHKSTTEAIVTHDKRTAAAAAVLNGRRALTVLLERFTHVAINYGQTGCNNDKQLARQNDPRYLHACFDKIQRSRILFNYSFLPDRRIL